MEKAIIIAGLKELSSTTSLTLGEVLYSVMLELNINSKSELLNTSDIKIVEVVDKLKKSLPIVDNRMTDTEWSEWINNKHIL